MSISLIFVVLVTMSTAYGAVTFRPFLRSRYSLRRSQNNELLEETSNMLDVEYTSPTYAELESTIANNAAVASTAATATTAYPDAIVTTSSNKDSFESTYSQFNENQSSSENNLLTTTTASQTLSSASTIPSVVKIATVTAIDYDYYGHFETDEVKTKN